MISFELNKEITSVGQRKNFFFVPRSWKNEKNIILYSFAELKTYQLSYYYLQVICVCRSFCSFCIQYPIFWIKADKTFLLNTL